ncbi:MAG: GGDEF domain-containing protein, partial [Candidatus Obscuribacterales bacterium]|nr:GGDEF domain-containing protein [Candidatus Obscuribacterales bacterium]
CNSLGLSKACIVFANTHPQPKVLFSNGKHTSESNMEKEKITNFLDELSDVAANECIEEKADLTLSWLMDAPFNFDAPKVFSLGFSMGLLAVDSKAPLSNHVKTTLGAVSWWVLNHALFDQLCCERITDALTSLPVRWYFEEMSRYQIQVARSRSTDLSIAISNIDGLRQVNDIYGIQGGDEIIRALAQRLRKELPQEIFCSRYSGDGFGILAPGYSADELFSIIEKARIKVSTPVELSEAIPEGQDSVLSSISTGIAELNESCTTYDDLINNADTALGKARTSGRNRTDIFDSI